MRCDDAQFYLRLRHPGRDELGADVSAALAQHLAGCPACAAASRSLSAFDTAVSAAMRAVPLPDGLRDRLLAASFARRGSDLRRRAYRFAAAAASVLLVVGLAVGLVTASRPQPDTRALAMRGDSLAVALGRDVPVNFPGNLLADPQAAQASEDAVRRWLTAEGLPPQLPEPFDYGLFLSHHWEDVQGRKVPVLWFRDRPGTGFAKVYVFRSTSFDLKAVRDDQASHCQAKAYPDAGVTYVVVFTGPDLAPFLRGRGPVALLG